MKHSKTPWSIKLQGREKQHAAIFASEFYEGMKPTDIAIIAYEMDIHNAKHIVKCVNNYDALVEALKEADEYLESYHGRNSIGTGSKLHRDWKKLLTKLEGK